MALIEEWTKRGQWLFRYRGSAPLLLLIPGLGIYLYDQVHPVYSFPRSGLSIQTYELICLAVSLFGLLIRVYTVGHSAKNTSGRNTRQQQADSLNTTGIYSLVRHPLYLGNFFMWLGAALLTENPWFILVFCLIYWIYYERIMFAEEQFLRQKFGDAYLKWSETVPAFLPNFRGFVPPETPMSWKKVLKKEKNGLAATFLVFFIFDVSGSLIRNVQEYNRWLAAGTVVTALLYVVLTIIKRRTGWLREDR
ncbi:MAG: methyltransferase family protein [Bacteroidales bacterium]